MRARPVYNGQDIGRVTSVDFKIVPYSTRKSFFLRPSLYLGRETGSLYFTIHFHFFPSENRIPEKWREMRKATFRACDQVSFRMTSGCSVLWLFQVYFYTELNPSMLMKKKTHNNINRRVFGVGRKTRERGVKCKTLLSAWYIFPLQHSSSLYILLSYCTWTFHGCPQEVNSWKVLVCDTDLIGDLENVALTLGGRLVKNILSKPSFNRKLGFGQNGIFLWKFLHSMKNVRKKVKDCKP